jgi:hypothetical protein
MLQITDTKSWWEPRTFATGLLPTLKALGEKKKLDRLLPSTADLCSLASSSVKHHASPPWILNILHRIAHFTSEMNWSDLCVCVPACPLSNSATLTDRLSIGTFLTGEFLLPIPWYKSMSIRILASCTKSVCLMIYCLHLSPCLPLKINSHSLAAYTIQTKDLSMRQCQVF